MSKLFAKILVTCLAICLVGGLVAGCQYLPEIPGLNQNPEHVHTLIHNAEKAPTCVNNGILEHWYCPGCNARFSDEAATTEVTFADLEVEENGHVAGADDGDCTTAVDCTVCGKVATPAAKAHTPEEDDGDCTTNVMCTQCAKVAIPAKAEHEQAEDDGDCTTAVTCAHCDHVFVPAAEAHEAGEDDGNCTTAVKCANCEKNAVEANEAHDFTGVFNANDTQHWHICANDGCEVIDEKVDHKATDDGDCTTDNKCDTCNWTVVEAGHSWTDVEAKAATCTEDGYAAHKACSACGETEGKSTIPATGHSFVNSDCTKCDEELKLNLQYRWGNGNTIQINTNLPATTPCVNFLANDNGCSIDQSVNKYQWFGWAGMANVDGVIVITLNFNNAFAAGQTYVLPAGAVFGFTDGNTYVLDANYVFIWDGSNWTVSDKEPEPEPELESMAVQYRWGNANTLQLNTNLPDTTPIANFLATDNGCNIDQSRNQYQQVGWIGMANANGIIVLTFNFGRDFEAGQTYVLSAGSVFGFTDGSAYVLDANYVFIWDGSNWTVSDTEPTPEPEENSLSLQYRWGAANVIQMNTNLPTTTPVANFTAGDNGCNIDQSGNQYQQVGWIQMHNPDETGGVMVLTFHFNNAFAAGQTYVLPAGAVFGFTDGSTYVLDANYTFTWDGSNWAMTTN